MPHASAGAGRQAVAAAAAVMVVWSYPVVEVWSRNVGIVGLPQVAPMLVATLATGLALLGLMAAKSRDVAASAVAVSLLSFCFWWYGPVQDALPAWFDDRRLLPIFAFTYAHLAYLLLRSRAAALGSGRAVLALLLGFGMLVALSLLRIVPGELRSATVSAPVADSGGTAEPGERVSIVFILLDEYASQRTMTEVWGFSPGIDQELAARGFFVAGNSISRYDATMWSLPTLLNMEYVTGPVEPHVFAAFSASLGGEQVATPAEIAGPGFGDLVAKINSNRLFAYARAAGYEITAIEGVSEYYPTIDLGDADLLFRYADVYAGGELLTDPFSYPLLRQSALRPWLRLRERKRSGHINHDGARFAFDYLASFRPSPAAPRLLYAHIMAPHAPYVFDRNGALPSAAASAAKGTKGLYLEQHRFVTGELLRTVDALLAQCANDCAVIIQSDHGPRPKDTGNDSADVMHQFRVLNAVYFPDRDYARFDDDIATVNVVRELANRYFGKRLSRLPDR
jgi:hypothetical protein